MMLLGALLAEARHKAVETTAVLGDTINAVDADTKAAADQVSAGEKKINEVRGLIGIVLHDLEDLSGRLERLREKLLAEAKSNIDRRNAIKFAIKIAGALCQVIPVGQPLLGSAGSLAAVSAGFVGGDLDSAPDTISKIGDVLQKGGAAVEKAQKVSGKSKEAGEKTPTDWSRVGDSLGSACSLVSEGVKALQVPKSEVEAELAKLEAQSPEWKELTRRIREVNDKKAKLFVGLEKAIASVGEGYSRLAANSSTRVRLRKQQDKALREVDTDSFFAVQKMSGQSRRTLQKYLYLLVKSYESTLLEAPSVDWRLADVTDKIKALVTSTQTWDAAALNAAADTLDTLFQQNLSKVRSDLLSRYDFGENTSTLDIVFTENQTSPVIADLNKARSTVIDPLALGLVLPGEHLARLSRVELTDLVFASGEPPLPAGTNVVVKLVPARRGTLRRGAGLYLLTSESPVRWGWTMSSSGTITAHTPSAASQDILDFILGPDGTAIKGKVSLPPLWSDLALSVELSPQSTDVTLPRISEARFRLHIDSSPAPELQRVLTVRPEGAVGDSVIGCTGDNAERGDGYGLMVRIYDQGAAVELVAPPLSGSVGFAGWKTSERGGEKPDPWKTTLDVTLADHLLVVPSWSHDESAARPPADLARLVQEVGEEALVESLVGQDGDLGAEGARRLLREQIEAQQVAPAAAGPEPRVLRAEPDTAGTVLGFVPGQGEADLVERGAGWDRVNYQGLVGWVEST
ncbi:hypothetical protein [Nocardiopsis changdeensis]|uniref:hypothetical protein n=1 Tax=Nocardiopsis changdeensis TaxID=2831969 RepID=UPI003F48C78E